MTPTCALNNIDHTYGYLLMIPCGVGPRMLNEIQRVNFDHKLPRQAFPSHPFVVAINF